jgi:hypothetical protein
MSAARPEVGAWYQTVGGDYLEVVAYDADEGSIEIQHFDGAVEEFDEDSWDELVLSSAEPPEDWSGSLDVSRDDYGVDLDRPAGASRVNPLDALDEREPDVE